MNWLAIHWLDIVTTILGLLYIWLEYRADARLWLIWILMPALDIVLYWQHGLYGDCGLAGYYLLAAVYGWIVWKWKPKANTAATGANDNGNNATGEGSTEKPITDMPAKQYLPATIFFALAWLTTWFVLKNYTPSTVPVLDGFTNAMSFVALWALARKYAQQWIFWILVDAVCCYLYVVKGIPFKAGLYGLYIIIAVAGFFKWRKMIVKA